MPRVTAPPPYEAPIAVAADRAAGTRLPKLKIGKDWFDWLVGQQAESDSKPARKAHVRVIGQNATIATTAIPLATVSPGLWRVSYLMRVTNVATTSSDLQFTLTWTAGGVTQTFTGAVINGNTTTTYQGGTLLVRPDAGTAISYQVTYNSNGAGEMQFELDVVAEEVALD